MNLFGNDKDGDFGIGLSTSGKLTIDLPGPIDLALDGTPVADLGGIDVDLGPSRSDEDRRRQQAADDEARRRRTPGTP